MFLSAVQGIRGSWVTKFFILGPRQKNLWKEFLKNDKVKPAGLGARDMLRLECGYSLYGHELEENISPLEAGLSRFVDLEKEFIGKEALLNQKEQGLKRKIVGFSSETRRSPRAGHKIYSEAGNQIGEVTSGTFSPMLNKGIGLGFVSFDHAAKGGIIHFGDEKNKISAIITGKIFYKEGSLKS